MSAAQLDFFSRNKPFYGTDRFKLLPISSLTQGPRQASLLSCPLFRRLRLDQALLLPGFSFFALKPFVQGQRNKKSHYKKGALR